MGATRPEVQAEWIQVRVRRSTMALLEEFQAGLDRAREMGMVDLETNRKTKKVSWNDVIRVAVQRALAHRERSKKKKKGEQVSQ